MFPKNIILLTAIVIVLTKISDSIANTNLADSANTRIVCYYAAWESSRKGIGKFTPENINPHLCTHILYAFVDLANDVTFKVDEIRDIKLGGFAKFTGLKRYNKNLKTMISVVTGNENIRKFYIEIINDVTKRSAFIKNSIEYLRKYNFDGIDLDWQFPYLEDKRSYSSFIQELREGYESESRETGRSRLQLSITLPFIKDHITKSYDLPRLSKYVDWINVLTYNYHWVFEPAVNHHSQLYAVDRDFNHELNANYTITYCLESGAEKNKLVLGIPTFGRIFKLSDPTKTDLGSPAAGPGSKGEEAFDTGFLEYHEICRRIKDDGWIAKQPYPNAMGSYAYKGDQWVGYDDENSMRIKAKYVAENKLGGIMIFAMVYDDFRGYCTGKNFPLIEAAKEALLAASSQVICQIPNSDSHTKYSILDQAELNYGPGEYVKQFSILETSCTKGYKLEPSASTISICKNGEWTEPPGACTRACPALQTTISTIVKCKHNNVPLQNCMNPIQGTTALLTCNPFYEDANPHKIPLHVCKNGKWNPPVSECSPVCGIKRPKGKPNIIKGEVATPGDYPWQVGIYNKKKELICGGSIIDQHIILSAAHCFTNPNGATHSPSNYFVTAGKFYRDYEDSRDENAQYSPILEIHVPERYTGIKGFFAFDIAVLILKDSFTLSVAVQPVCVELNEESQYLHLSENNKGIITGWGYTQEGSDLSEQLKELIIPFIPYAKCYQEITERFRKFYTFDKICGGYLDNATAVCGGDSGGALVFKNTLNDRYFAKGIVSTSPSKVSDVLECDSNQYSLYTDIDHHIDFLRNIITFNRRQESIETE